MFGEVCIVNVLLMLPHEQVVEPVPALALAATQLPKAHVVLVPSRFRTRMSSGSPLRSSAKPSALFMPVRPKRGSALRATSNMIAPQLATSAGRRATGASTTMRSKNITSPIKV
eukprot:2144450-Amphidinium_carterae.1